MGNASVQRGLFLTFRLFSLIRHALRRATFPVGEGDLPAGERSSGPGLNFQGSPPHPARATPGPPSPSRRGLEPLIRQGLWPCHLPRGGRLPPAGERSSGAGLNFQGSPPHPARATPGPPSPSRRGLEPLIRQGLWPCHLPRGGRLPPAGEGTEGLFSGPCVFWHCMVQCPKIGKRQVERGAFSVQSQDPAGHYGVLCEAPEPMAPG